MLPALVQCPAAALVARAVRGAGPRLIVYGLRVSPLDVELGFLLQAAARQRKNSFGEVVVVDPDHQAVIRNLRVHLRDQNYIGVDPRQLQDLKLEWY